MDRYMNHFDKLLDLGVRYVFDPSVEWVINHPTISVMAVAVLVYVSVRNYRML
jgi:hypothetical protein